jgi:hypothetical protein
MSTATIQFRVLYREFLFRVVDREVLSVTAQGDASKLLGRLAAILILISIPFSFAIVGVGDRRLSEESKFVSAWGIEHALIATTMLIVGLFAVLSWDSAYPDRRDALVLGPLPVRASTIFLAKIAALSVALGSTVAVFNAASGLLFPFALAPRQATPLDLLISLQFYRSLAAYWITVFAVGAFALSCVLVVQGVAGQLPRGAFLRFSAILQLSAFCAFLTDYFLEPSLTSPSDLIAPVNHHLLLCLPSYWFLAMFQQLNGSLDGSAARVLLELATRGWIALAVAGFTAALLFLLSYLRTLRKIIEQPDIGAGVHRLAWLPTLRNPVSTVITQFSIRTLLRSRLHRVLLSFYTGMGFAIVILFMKTSDAQQLSAASSRHSSHHLGLPLLASSFVMMGAWILGNRVVFNIPLELRANWTFRLTQTRPVFDYFVGIHRTAYVLALAPAWCASAVVFLSVWPWLQALAHAVVLLLLGVIAVELWLYNFQKIPFTCSYLPGRSNVHVTFLLCLMLGLNVIYWSASFELRALSDLREYLWIVAGLLVAASLASQRRARANNDGDELQFEAEMPPVITSLGI